MQESKSGLPYKRSLSYVGVIHNISTLKKEEEKEKGEGEHRRQGGSNEKTRHHRSVSKKKSIEERT